MVTFGLAGGKGFDPLVLLLIGLGVEACVGEMRPVFRRIPHPVVVIGRLVEAMEIKLNRENRSHMDRAVRGFFLTISVVGLCAVIGWGVAWLTQHHDFGWTLELFLVVALLAQRSLYDHVYAVDKALAEEGVESARKEVAHIVGRRTDQLDGCGVARAAIESCAENFGDGVVAPVFWYVLFGFPGLLVYKAVNTMDSMIGHKTERYRAFGMAAARLDDILNLIPARLAGLFIVLASVFAPSAKPFAALKVMLRDSGKHRSPNAGWPEGAMAGALDLALAGPRRYAEHIVDDPWIGDGATQAAPQDISRCLYIYVVACLINAMWVAAIAMIRYGPGLH
ncbi:MAG: cobalamin biosynthesis protein CobD [Rhodospirillales bacterium RIFCSPLOWO2_12_FULL_58_28]|nr:MAG: cobalamin biosynthesis protein CobD [Rhodospirillales bacterium RIFCSPLOWO2_02_FULL_58_16]OHC78573.1 MAG: cobalamin biosynthesis protein CobD [Rhodospirillales bacterium RIFCSPLOWO2_12_FULL_58_28]